VVSFADSLDCVGIVSKDVTSASKVFGSFLPAPFYQEFYIHRRRRQDALSVFDENDPTAARPTTRENARELCSEHMTEWASSNSNTGDLTKLRIGIPQVCPLAVTSPLFDLIITGSWV
jgi:aspartyl-tRNA(Asn)/glutamyl-tRNA(Gln) amidotransferase subunit A